jgi:hypothetical protein
MTAGAALMPRCVLEATSEPLQPQAAHRLAQRRRKRRLQLIALRLVLTANGTVNPAAAVGEIAREGAFCIRSTAVNRLGHCRREGRMTLRSVGDDESQVSTRPARNGIFRCLEQRAAKIAAGVCGQVRGKPGGARPLPVACRRAGL